tara:strand:- start:322 stop:552 length:231 start_codon:yes stop_codon:yes gene_type:complete
MTTDKEHLQWMLNRLAEVHGENRNVDYMMRMQKIIDSTKTELNLHLVSSCSNERADNLEIRLFEIEKRFKRFDAYK